MATIREAYIQAASQYRGLPLLLSGGVDSATALAAFLAIGETPHCYTFQFGEFPSTDVKVATDMCRTFKLKHTIVKVPRDEETIVADVRRVIPHLVLFRKTHIQCSIPFIYIAQQLTKDGFNKALMAMATDDLLGNGRDGYIIFKEQGEEAFRKHRYEKHHNPTDTDFSVKATARHYGVELEEIAETPIVEDTLLSKNFAELHRPREKWGMLKAFPEFWKRGKWYRPNMSLQVCSGIRDAHDCLLNSKYNRGRHKAVIGIYNDIAAGRV